MIRPVLRRVLVVVTSGWFVSTAGPPLLALADGHDLARMTAVARAVPIPPGARPLAGWGCPPGPTYHRCVVVPGDLRALTFRMARAVAAVAGGPHWARCVAYSVGPPPPSPDLGECEVRVDDGAHGVAVRLWQETATTTAIVVVVD